ncbi:MAG: DUF4335 domain-containing protein, partial [Leptolyngbyaceae cyanobacterium bins.59]|nr:DUF4335 domain-containing protein [Leptolyngbyaceae cyanobacterium bins.59]
MTIQRQYSLPNCTLILHGLNQSIGFGAQTEVRPLISILMTTECHFAGHNEVLRGGREFFESLIFAVSTYAQEFLSQVQMPIQERLRQRPSVVLVYLERIDRNLHRLTVKPQDPNDPNQANAAQLNLTTVHLFDLVEAIDQFFADPQTLPDLSLQLAPLPKRYAVSREPLVERAAPVAIGASGLVLAAAALFMLPVPEVKRTEPSPTTAEPGAVQSPASSPSPGAAPTTAP